MHHNKMIHALRRKAKVFHPPPTHEITDNPSEPMPAAASSPPVRSLPFVLSVSDFDLFGVGLLCVQFVWGYLPSLFARVPILPHTREYSGVITIDTYGVDLYLQGHESS